MCPGETVYPPGMSLSVCRCGLTIRRLSYRDFYKLVSGRFRSSARCSHYYYYYHCHRRRRRFCYFIFVIIIISGIIIIIIIVNIVGGLAHVRLLFSKGNEHLNGELFLKAEQVTPVSRQNSLFRHIHFHASVKASVSSFRSVLTRTTWKLNLKNNNFFN